MASDKTNFQIGIHQYPSERDHFGLLLWLAPHGHDLDGVVMGSLSILDFWLLDSQFGLFDIPDTQTRLLSLVVNKRTRSCLHSGRPVASLNKR